MDTVVNSAAETVKWLNTVGLISNIAGVALVFKYGWPQPSHEPGVNIVLSPENALEDGMTAAEYDRLVEGKRTLYQWRSSLGFALMAIGFAFQLLANWR
jgi:hypothetical protein